MRFIVIAALLLTSLCAQTDPFQLSAEQRTGTVKMIYVNCHSHLDIGYTRPADQVARDYKDDIDTAIRIARENSDFRWTIETTWMLEEWLRRTNDEKLVSELAQLTRTGRLELGVFFASMNSGTMGTEETNRLVYAGERLRRRLGIEGVVAFHNDVPGSSWSYPRVLAGSGVKYLVTGLNTNLANPSRPPMHPGNNLSPANRPFYWVGPDSSRVLQWFNRDLMQYGEAGEWRLGAKASGVVHPIEEAERMVPRRLAWLERNGYPYDRYLLMASPGDNTDPYLAYLTLLKIREWNRRHPELPMRMSTAEEFFRDLIAKYGDRFPVHSGDATGGWEEKKLNAPDSAAKMRWVSNALPAAETAATLASILRGAVYPRFDFDDAWRRLLVYHEHSNGEGDWGVERNVGRTERDWNVVEYYAQALYGFSDVRQQFEKSLRLLAGMRAHGHPLDTSGDSASSLTVMAYNGLSWTRSGPVVLGGLPRELQDGPLSVVDITTSERLAIQDLPGKPRQTVFFARDVPGTGYRLYRIERHAGPPPVPAQKFPVEVLWNSEGWITSIRDTAGDREMVDAGSDKLFGGLYSGGRGPDSRPIDSGKASVKVDEGPVVKRIEITRPGPLVATVVTLYRDAPYADLAFELDLSTVNREIRRYSVALPFRRAGEVILDGAGFVYRVPEDRLPGGGGPDRLAVHFTHFKQGPSWGITLANQDGAFWGLDPLFSLAVVPGPVAAGGRSLLRSEPVLARSQTFRFRVGVQGAEPDGWERLGCDLNLPFQVLALTNADMPPSRQLVEISDPRVQMLALKPAQDREGWYALRLQDIGGKGAANVKVKLPFPVAEALSANTVERPTGVTVDLSAVSVKPWQTLTILVKAR